MVFRCAQKYDIPRLVVLMNAQYKRQKTPAYFEWQYFSLHHDAVLLCAYYGEQLAGIFGLQKRKLNNGASVGQAIDMLVAPEFRGTGLFGQLAHLAFQRFPEADLFCVFPNLNGKKACEKSLGWKTLGKINPMSLSGTIPIEPYKASSGPVPNDRVRFVYSQETLAWRFQQHPEYRYTRVPEHGNPYAFIKLFVDPAEGGRHGDIVYMDGNLSDAATVQSLVRKACMALKHQGVQDITTWALPLTPLHAAVHELLFQEISQERYFCVTIVNSKYDDLNDLMRWQLFQSDTEVY